MAGLMTQARAHIGRANDGIANEALVLDMIAWIAKGPRPYDEVMEAWRTSCPRFPVWEDAVDHGLVTVEHHDGASLVRATAAGVELLLARRPAGSKR
jgi:D-3-phosphoglycerate dehydrogenase